MADTKLILIDKFYYDSHIIIRSSYDMLLTSAASSVATGGNVVNVYDYLDHSLFAIEMMHGNTTLTIGGNLSQGSLTINAWEDVFPYSKAFNETSDALYSIDSVDISPNHNVYSVAYNDAQVHGAILFNKDANLVLTAQNGTRDADKYHDAVDTNGGTLLKTDDALSIRSDVFNYYTPHAINNGTEYKSYDGETLYGSSTVVSSLTNHTISAAGNLNVKSDLAGNIETNVAALYSGTVSVSVKTYKVEGVEDPIEYAYGTVQDNASGNKIAGTALNIGGALNLESNFRADVIVDNSKTSFSKMHNQVEDSDVKAVGNLSFLKKDEIGIEEIDRTLFMGIETSAGAANALSSNSKTQYKTITVSGNDITLKGIDAGTVELTNGTWAGDISVDNRHVVFYTNHKLADALFQSTRDQEDIKNNRNQNLYSSGTGKDYVAYKKHSVVSGNKLIATGIEAGTVTISNMGMLHRDYDGTSNYPTEKDFAKINVKVSENEFTTAGVTDSEIGNYLLEVNDNTIEATAVKATNLTIGNIEEGVEINVDASLNKYESGKNTKGNTISAYGFMADKMELDAFRGTFNLTVDNNVLTQRSDASKSVNYFDEMSITVIAVSAASSLTSSFLGGEINISVSNNIFAMTKDLMHVAAIEAVNLSVAGVIDSSINIVQNGNDYIDSIGTFGINADKLNAIAFTGDIKIESDSGLAQVALQSKNGLGDVNGDDFDFAGSIKSNRGIVVGQAANLRIAGRIESEVHAVVTNQYLGEDDGIWWINSHAADKLEFASTAYVKGNVDLHYGANEVVIHSGAQFFGTIHAEGGSAKISFVLDENANSGRPTWVLNYDAADIQSDKFLGDSSAVNITLSDAKVGTYNLVKYDIGMDVSQYWGRTFIFRYMDGEAKITFDAENSNFSGVADIEDADGEVLGRVSASLAEVTETVYGFNGDFTGKTLTEKTTFVITGGNYADGSAVEVDTTGNYYILKGFLPEHKYLYNGQELTADAYGNLLIDRVENGTVVITGELTSYDISYKATVTGTVDGYNPAYANDRFVEVSGADGMTFNGNNFTHENVDAPQNTFKVAEVLDSSTYTAVEEYAEESKSTKFVLTGDFDINNEYTLNGKKAKAEKAADGTTTITVIFGEDKRGVDLELVEIVPYKSGHSGVTTVYDAGGNYAWVYDYTEENNRRTFREGEQYFVNGELYTVEEDGKLFVKYESRTKIQRVITNFSIVKASYDAVNNRTTVEVAFPEFGSTTIGFDIKFGDMTLTPTKKTDREGNVTGFSFTVQGGDYRDITAADIMLLGYESTLNSINGTLEEVYVHPTTEVRVYNEELEIGKEYTCDNSTVKALNEITLDNLVAGAKYEITINGADYGNFTADANGKIVIDYAGSVDTATIINAVAVPDHVFTRTYSVGNGVTYTADKIDVTVTNTNNVTIGGKTAAASSYTAAVNGEKIAEKKEFKTTYYSYYYSQVGLPDELYGKYIQILDKDGNILYGPAYSYSYSKTFYNVSPGTTVYIQYYSDDNWHDVTEDKIYTGTQFTIDEAGTFVNNGTDVVITPVEYKATVYASDRVIKDGKLCIKVTGLAAGNSYKYSLDGKPSVYFKADENGEGFIQVDDSFVSGELIITGNLPAVNATCEWSDQKNIVINGEFQNGAWYRVTVGGQEYALEAVNGVLSIPNEDLPQGGINVGNVEVVGIPDHNAQDQIYTGNSIVAEKCLVYTLNGNQTVENAYSNEITVRSIYFNEACKNVSITYSGYTVPIETAVGYFGNSMNHYFTAGQNVSNSTYSLLMTSAAYGLSQDKRYSYYLKNDSGKKDLEVQKDSNNKLYLSAADFADYVSNGQVTLYQEIIFTVDEVVKGDLKSVTFNGDEFTSENAAEKDGGTLEITGLTAGAEYTLNIDGKKYTAANGKITLSKAAVDDLKGDSKVSLQRTAKEAYSADDAKNIVNINVTADNGKYNVYVNDQKFEQVISYTATEDGIILGAGDYDNLATFISAVDEKYNTVDFAANKYTYEKGVLTFELTDKTNVPAEDCTVKINGVAVDGSYNFDEGKITFNHMGEIKGDTRITVEVNGTEYGFTNGRNYVINNDGSVTLSGGLTENSKYTVKNGDDYLTTDTFEAAGGKLVVNGVELNAADDDISYAKVGEANKTAAAAGNLKAGVSVELKGKYDAGVAYTITMKNGENTVTLAKDVYADKNGKLVFSYTGEIAADAELTVSGSIEYTLGYSSNYDSLISDFNNDGVNDLTIHNPQKITLSGLVAEKSYAYEILDAEGNVIPNWKGTKTADDKGNITINCDYFGNDYQVKLTATEIVNTENGLVSDHTSSREIEIAGNFDPNKQYTVYLYKMAYR